MFDKKEVRVTLWTSFLLAILWVIIKTCWFFLVDYIGNISSEVRKSVIWINWTSFLLSKNPSKMKPFSVLGLIYDILSTESNLFTNTKLPMKLPAASGGEFNPKRLNQQLQVKTKLEIPVMLFPI